MSVLFPNVWKTQPQHPTQLIPNHPFLVGMKAEVVVSPASGLRSMVDAPLPTVSGAWTRYSSGLGQAGCGTGMGYDETGGDISGYWHFPNRTAASANGGTFAGVLVKTTTVSAGSNNFAYYFFFGNSTNVGPAATTVYNVGTQFAFYHDSTQLGSNVAITIGVPYFIICAWEAKGASSAWYIKVKNLNTGKVDSDQSGTRTYSGSGSSTWQLAGGSNFGRAMPGFYYFAAMGSQYLPPALAEQWLQDPWKVFKPTKPWWAAFTTGGATTIALALASLGFTKHAAQPAVRIDHNTATQDWTAQPAQPKVAVGLNAPTLNQDGTTHNTSVVTNTTGAQLSWSAKALSFFQATLVQLSAATLRFTSYAIEATGAVAAAASSRYYTLRRFLGRR